MNGEGREPAVQILEELVAGVRSLESRFRDAIEEAPGFRVRRRRLHPMMIHDLARTLGHDLGGSVQLLVLASLFRDDMPWVYELGMEAYRATREGTGAEAREATRRFQRAAESMRHGPWPFEDVGIDPKMVHMLLRELDHSPEDHGEPARPIAGPSKVAEPKAEMVADRPRVRRQRRPALK